MMHSKSMSAFKQNQLPKKQGAFYQLNLGKNNGPFLSKDIMYNNRKSMALITNKQILKSHETMVDTMKNLQKSKKQFILSPQKVQNFNGVIDYCTKQLHQLSIISHSMKIQERQLHGSLQQVGRKTTLLITQLYDSSMPAMRQFFKKVKQANNNDKSEHYQLKRELEKISLESSLLKKGLVECENRIQSLEKIFENEKDRANEGTALNWI